MTNDLVDWVQRLLAPPPERPGHEYAHDHACIEVDAGRSHE